MQPNDLIAAKINATLRILEWARGDIEPGISGTPEKTHIALAEAFREIYRIVEDSIETKTEVEQAETQTDETSQATAVPIGGEETSA